MTNRSPSYYHDLRDLRWVGLDLRAALRRVALMDNSRARAFLAAVPARLNRNEAWFVLQDIQRAFPAVEVTS